ncbi:MAG: DUF456 domain-containing protein [Actinomycetota bacterium]
MDPTGLVVVGIAIAAGLVGIVVAAIPGLILVWAAVGAWALVERSTIAWIMFGIATLLAIGGQVVKYLVPGRRLKDAGIPNRSLLVGVLFSLVGFFLIPVVGFIVGFVVGVFVAERVRLGDGQQAWTSTKQALKAASLSIVIELAAGLAIAGLWLGTVLFA